MGLMAMMDNQLKQVKYIETKQDVINVKNSLLRSLGSNPTCCQLANAAVGDLTFSTLTPTANVNFQNFFKSCTGSPPSVFLNLGGGNADLPSLNVQSMDLQNLSGSSDNYSGDLVIKLANKNSGYIEPKPINLAITVRTQDAGPNTKKIVSCSTGSPSNNKLSLDCIDLKNQCTVGTGPAFCNSPDIPANYVITGGSCISSSDNGAGRLLTMSSPTGSHWSCGSKDHSLLSPGVLISTVHACALTEPALPTPTIDCQTISNTCITSPSVIGTCNSGAGLTGYSLVGGGCTSTANPTIGRLLTGSYPDATNAGWNCQDKDHITTTGGSLTSYGIFCKLNTAIVGTLNCKQIASSSPGTKDSPLSLNVEAPTNYALTSVGCNTVNAPAGRLLTSLGIASSPSQSASCSNKDHGAGAGTGGLTTIYAIGCSF